MILVVTGTHPQQFNRLLEEVDRLVGNHTIKEPVLMQTGYSDYKPKNCKWFKFTGYDEMNSLLKKASIVITHGGIGSVLMSVRMNKKTIVVPRMKKFKEHTNDHQLEIVKELSRQRRIIPVYDISKLALSIESAKSFKPVHVSKSYTIQTMISEFLDKMEQML